MPFIPTCEIEDCDNPVEGRTTLCATHNHEQRKAEKDAIKAAKKREMGIATAFAKSREAKKAVKKVSEKTSKNLTEYSRLKKEFIVGKICPIYPHLKVTDIHHMKGRAGSLLLDTRYWLAVSRKGHVKIELNPSWAREQGFSLERN